MFDLSTSAARIRHAAPLVVVVGIAVASSVPAAAQDSSTDNKRIWGIIPNYRTSPTLTDYQPLTPKQKWRMAADDALDRGTFILGAIFGAEAQLTDETPSFGHGWAAFARYFAASTTDFVVGDFMTEGLYPTVFRQDPRYFRRGTGTGAGRLGYAMGQIFWTHTDSGTGAINFSEIIGNATAVGIGNLYYPDNRTLSNNLYKLGVQLAVDMVGNVIKEFSPDLERHLSRHKAEQ